MGTLEAILLAFLQGVTELFPISSLGHAVIVPALLHWPIDLHAPDFLPFLVVMHLGTAAALVVYFARDWLALGGALIGMRGGEAKAERRLLAHIVIATLPAVIIGLVFERLVRDAFATPLVAALFLVVNGAVLFFGERLKGRGGRPLEALGWRGALGIGAAQCLAFIPGLSRSGVSMVGGLLAGLDHEAAARFSFLLATPIIAGASVLEVPKLMRAHAGFGGAALIAGMVAGITAYASIAVLMRYFRKHEFEALNPFAYYCVVAGLLAGGLLLHS